MQNSMYTVLTPIYFEDKRDTESTIKDWSSKIRSNDSSMNITDPSYVSSATDCCNNFVSDNGIESYGDSVRTIGCNHLVSIGEDAQEAYAYNSQKGKNKANLEAELDREKRKERTSLTHGFADYGFTRAKAFSDGMRIYNVIANGRIEEIQRWLISNKEYVRLLISDTTPSYIKREVHWTDIFDVSELEKDKFIEELLSRYFKPSDSKVYDPISIKDFRSRLYEEIHSTKVEEVQTTIGWFKFGGKRVYYDGSDFPKKDHILSCMKRSCYNSNKDIEEVLNGICKELDEVDIGNRLSFLIGYGLVTWFSSVCTLDWNKRPGVMLLGRESVCRRYTEACLKMYTRTNGSDIIEFTAVDKRALTEYVDVLKDDAFAINCNYISRVALKLVKAIVAGRNVANHSLNAPIVALQNIPDSELIYEDYITIDLNGFEVSESFCSNMQELKAELVSIFEADLHVDNVENREPSSSYEDVAKVVFSLIKSHLFAAGLSMTVLDRFFAKLEQGVMLKRYFCGNDKDTLVHMLKQRLEQIITSGKVSVTGEVEIGVPRDPKRSFIIKGNSVYIPAKYMEEVVLALLNISRSDFYRVREVLIGKELLNTYNVGKNYTKRITVSKGERIYAYELDKSLFTTFEKNGL